MDLNFEEDALEMYNEYLMFIRRKMNDDLQLGKSEEELWDIEIDDIQTMKKTNTWKFLCLVVEDEKVNKNHAPTSSTYIYEGIGFDSWIKMLRREKRLKELGI